MIAQTPLSVERLRPRFDEPLFAIGGTTVTTASLIAAAAILLVTWGASLLFQRALTGIYRRRSIDTGVQYALNRLLHYSVLAVGIVVALDNIGFSVTALAGLGAILAVGIGFGLQNITQNFVSGIILLLERPVKQGDFVVVGETRGTVRSIRARATIVTTLDNVDILVPNGQFITEPVVNQTYADRFVRVRINVGVAYGSDTELVRRTLLEIADEHPGVVNRAETTVLFRDFGESSLDFTLIVWVGEAANQARVASDLRFAIDAAFRNRGIQIPFPQRDLHLKSGFTAT
ncbi:MAG TPA: mechanosensitive ion channel domain-containing protein [Longimicrobiales bacterium]